MSLIELLGFGTDGWGSVLLLAALMTVALTLAALAVGAVFGALVAAAKLSRHRSARLLGDLYTTVFRGVPELLVIYLFYFGGSTLVTTVGQWFGAEGFVGVPPFVIGALAVGMISGAYQAEVYRAAVLAVSKGELEAARSIGMPARMVLRRILIPQVLRFALPGIGNVWQLSLKDSALISVTGLAELLRTSQIAANSTHQYFVFFVAGGALYLLMTGLSNRVFNRVEAHVGRSFRRNFARN
ncbi:ABC transporter permease [Burkholderia oklahomensis]|uniref:Amino ABC transporter, permease, 3-TM region, His/Glu/Gln/Arg/opine family domain protein n=1 Tax=Burkholderia oklahomensis TaxID=342113 RepID=A0AAI8BC97_9BURK|nr:ABC transporter permease subunit [Burkholderia oklahomensis]AIO69518.1 amino ABC transporter, permease, 3-TM region, His/Glu/Gln/Arg/opine family domain protein [Burkholderia oklahomensis]AJX35192.1 amino ABC transporter, permease, 3-TM region, His/Glu/Gln/Arg/opine family domain protein [Burkholderia oklahomensis C6786]AOI38268.1 ABC transporter permease [Burkholderia oklahomensis EO147]AOI47990.1 ABC transporter permease [Burkholderia oklahomensis C6786]KUY48609.1 ABC transporter permease